MRRREFLLGSMAFTQLLATRAVLAQPRGQLVRAAIVIGVNKSGNLPVLNAAAFGARLVEDWLKREGFEVRLFVDDQQPVKMSDLFDSIKQLVDRGTLDQLVIYFSGHGFLNFNSELWMLSEAPDNPNEAVSLPWCITLSRRTAIPNIVFISDACRSTPQSIGVGSVRGGSIFPNYKVRSGVQPEVDLFFATLPGDPAFEVPVVIAAANHQGIFTASFLEAFERPYPEMVKTVNGVKVIPNRNLKRYLLSEVPKKAAAKSIQLNQQPDSRIESGENTYIGRAGLAHARPGPTPATIIDVVNTEFLRAGLGSLSSPGQALLSDKIVKDLDVISKFDAARYTILLAKGPRQFESKTGFAVNGARVTYAVATRGTKAEILDEGDGHDRPGIIRIWPNNNSGAASLGLRFGDGSGTVIATLRGYSGTVVVEKGRVTNVSYIPSQNSGRWRYYAEKRNYLDKLRALFAAAARFGAFRIEGDGDESSAEKAKRLGDKIRVLKGIDPTLGLYAAYAYAEANIIEQVRSVQFYMHNDLGTDLFDVALLAGSLSPGGSDANKRPVPFCPMLNQGWGLLRVNDVRLPPIIERASDHLRPALWTTFDEKGMSFVIEAFQKYF